MNEEININNTPLSTNLQIEKKIPAQFEFMFGINDEIFDDIKNIKHSNSYIELEKKFYQNLEEKIKNREIRLFILKNLFRKEDMSFSWKLNLEVLRDNLEIIGGNFNDKERFEKKTLFFKGEKSNYIQNEDHKLIHKMFPNSEIISVPNAGHWVQNNNLEFVYEKTKEFLENG